MLVLLASQTPVFAHEDGDSHPHIADVLPVLLAVVGVVGVILVGGFVAIRAMAAGDDDDADAPDDAPGG
jgi:hypothetical protein